MKTLSMVTGEQLVNALHMLGVEFIMGGQFQNESLHKQPARLIAALTQSTEARLRLSLIPLFLDHPEFASFVPSILAKLKPADRLILKCYYTAAVWLQQQHRNQLITLIGNKASLPDYFSLEIGLEISDDPEDNLRSLAECQRVLSGAQVNWLGTYHHAAQVMLRGLELQKA
jgi:hypothetical protein